MCENRGKKFKMKFGERSRVKRNNRAPLTTDTEALDCSDPDKHPARVLAASFMFYAIGKPF